MGKATWLEGLIEKIIAYMMYIIKHPRWKVRRHINQKKKKEPKHKEPKFVIYDMFEVPKPSPIQQNRTSKPKCTPKGPMKKISKDDNMMIYGYNKKIGGGMLYSISRRNKSRRVS